MFSTIATTRRLTCEVRISRGTSWTRRFRTRVTSAAKAWSTAGRRRRSKHTEVATAIETQTARPPDSGGLDRFERERLGSVGGGVRREAVPNLQVIDPLINRESSAAVKIRHEDAVDGSVVGPHVRPVVIDDHLAVHGHPDAAIGCA